MKKITRVVLCMSMLLCASFVYSQQQTVPDTIRSEADFWAMSPNGNYIQMASFTLTDSNKIIGDNMTVFSGTYDGNGYGIGCNIERLYPLFPPISGTVKNLVIHNTTVKGELDNSGIITSHLKEGGLIDHVMLSYIGIYNGKNTGGIAGFMDGGTIRFSSVASITVSDTVDLQGSMGGGGIVGYMKKGNIYNCAAAYGGYHPNAVAGIVGLVDNTNDSDTTVIESCWWSSLIQDSVLKGLTVGTAGHPGMMSAIANVLNAEDNVTIKNCYAKTQSQIPLSATNNEANNIPENCYSQATTNFSYSQLVDSLNSGMDVPSFLLLNDTTITLNRGELMYTTKDGSFRNDSTWGGYSYYPSILQEVHIRHQLDIPGGETMIVPASAVVIVEDEAWTTIEDGASLLLCGDNREITNVKVKKTLSDNKWNFIGFPNVENVSPLANVDYDIWALPFDYASNEWDEDNFLHWTAQIHDTVSRGNGIFVWPDSDGDITAESDGSHIEKNIVVTKNIQGSPNGNGYWMALANPYLGKLDVAKFIDNHNDVIAQLQGQGIYIYNGIDFAFETAGEIPVGEGFFVNMVNNGSQTINFQPSQMVGYPSAGAKAVAREKEYVKVSVSTEGYKVPVMICQNDLAGQEYDIFDANKMFGDGSVAEPYFVTEGINLCKEEIKNMPYYATMNIKSGEARTVEIVADAIPEGYSATLIDGEDEIELTEGMVYTTDIASGENAERFKLLIGEKNVSLESAEAIENLIQVSNIGRRVNISARGAIEVEVYNALGQKVYTTANNSFTLEGVSAGAYIIKVSNGKSVKSERIIVQ